MTKVKVFFCHIHAHRQTHRQSRQKLDSPEFHSGDIKTYTTLSRLSGELGLFSVNSLIPCEFSPHNVTSWHQRHFYTNRKELKSKIFNTLCRYDLNPSFYLWDINRIPLACAFQFVIHYISMADIVPSFKNHVKCSFSTVSQEPQCARFRRVSSLPQCGI